MFLLFHLIHVTVFDTSLTWQYRVTVGKMRLSREALCKSLYDSIGAAFVSDEEKTGLRTLIKNHLEKNC